MISIFTEGEWDTPFIRELIKRVFGQDMLEDIRIIDTNGYTALGLNQPLFQETTDAGGVNLVIYDAVAANNGGGYQNRYEYLMSEKQKLGLEFNLFLFPNNQDEGMFETLLESIVNETHKSLIGCFEGYLNCVNENGKANGIDYTLPAQKAKMFAYIESIMSPGEFKTARNKQSWGYSNDDIWDFDSPHLDSLKDFLRAHIQK